MLAFNSNVPFALELECPLRKGQRNGPANHEQRGTGSSGSDGTIARETDGTKNSGGGAGAECPAGEAAVASLSGKRGSRAGIEAAREAQSPSIGQGDGAGCTRPAERALCGLWADLGPREISGAGRAEDEFGERAQDHDRGGAVEGQASPEAGSASDAGTTRLLWRTGANGRDGS